MNLRCLIGHQWMTVDESTSKKGCMKCLKVNIGCPHSFRVCTRCGKAVGYGSRGRLRVIPDGCKKQIDFIRMTLGDRSVKK